MNHACPSAPPSPSTNRQPLNSTVPATGERKKEAETATARDLWVPYANNAGVFERWEWASELALAAHTMNNHALLRSRAVKFRLASTRINAMLILS